MEPLSINEINQLQGNYNNLVGNYNSLYQEKVKKDSVISEYKKLCNRINNTSCMSLKQARKMIKATKQLVKELEQESGK